MQTNFRTVVRIFFLALIFVLWLSGKIAIWSGLIIAGILIAPFLGRIYCGWVCPIFTAFDIFAPLFKKPLFIKYANFLENRIFQILIFAFFIAVFFLTRKFSIPFFIMLIPVGLLVAALFGTAAWHHICPFGVIFSLPARFATYGYAFNSQDCIKCGLCIKKCENNCLHFDNEKNLYIDKKHCLACGKCQTACKQNNIAFRKLSNNKNA